MSNEKEITDVLNRHDVELAELKTRVDYKHERIDELKQEIQKIDKKIDKIDECLNQIVRKSQEGDFNIDNRVTKVENTINVLKWVVGIGLSIVATAIAVLGFLLTVIH